MEYTRREIAYLATVVLVLSLVFGFNDGREKFEWSAWMLNFIKIMFIVAISVFIHDFAHDLMAKKHGFISEYRVWGIRRFGFGEPAFPKEINLFGKKLMINHFPIGIIIALLVMLISNGKAFFTGISSYGLVIKKTHRLGNKFIEVTDFEEAKIALAGPMANIFIAIIFSIFNASGTFDSIIMINSWMAFWDMFPLPGLDGSKVFWGSKPLYVFSFIFIVGIILLTRIMSALPALLLAVCTALLFLGYYMYRFFKG